VGEKAKNRQMCYVNADIILMNDLLQATRQIRFQNFLVLGQRWNIDLKKLWDFERPDWEIRLRQLVVNHGDRHPPWGSDFFIFPRYSSIGELPEFAVGRAGWDNWLIYRARKLCAPVIDVTRAVTVIHQNHEYWHIQEGRGYRSWGRESDRNLRLAGGRSCLFNCVDATHTMTCKRRILPAIGITHLHRHMTTLPILYPDSSTIKRIIHLLTLFVAK
jgi:hypothetical protein